jgi:2-C-methyl-D-erythritol 4-phosphate cytidylyltransferase
MRNTWAILLAAGSGTRFGSAKQFTMLDGERVVDRSLATVQASCAHVVLVLPPGVVWDGKPVDAVVAGGATRAESVRAGLAAIPNDADVIVVHDAARALASTALFVTALDALVDDVDAVIPGLPVTDTLKRVHDDRVVGTVPRDDLIAVQTPQVFRAATLRAAHASGGDATDDAAFIEAAGGVVAWVAGAPENVKLTHPNDIALMESYIERRPSQASEAR